MKQVQKTLKLKKETIDNLNTQEMKTLKGGVIGYTVHCSYYCSRKYC